MDLDAAGDSDFIDAGGEGISVPDKAGQEAEIIGTHREDLPVEVLSLDLDRCQETLQDLPNGTFEIIQAPKIDRHFVTGLTGCCHCRLGRQELDNWHSVVAGETVQAWNGEAPLATFIGPEHSSLELAFGCALHVLE